MTLTADFPIAIIGAGPGGLFTSMWLSKLGMKHVLIDGNKFPRDKSCGDVLPSIVLRNLNEIDPKLILGMLETGMLSPLSATKFNHPSNASLSLKYKGIEGLENDAACYSVKRSEFDHFLLDYVKKSRFTSLALDTHIQGITAINEGYLLSSRNQRIQAKLIIIASGSSSSLAQKLGLPKASPKHYALGIRAYYTGIDCKRDEPEFIVDKSLFPGGVYITPLSNGFYNVNVVMKKDVAIERQVNLEESFYSLLKTNPNLAKKFQNAKQVVPFRGAALFLGTKNRKICGNRFMLVGDAAGLIDLLSANGIPQAALSAKIAAYQAEACFAENNFSEAFMHRYELKVHERVKGLLSLAKLVNPIASYRIFQLLSFALLRLVAGKPFINRMLQALAYERRPLFAMMNPFFYRTLLRAN